MTKAFIFDNDGVIIDTENASHQLEHDFFISVLGEEIFKKIGSSVGLSHEMIAKEAEKYGVHFDPKQYEDLIDKHVEEIFGNSPITSGVNALARDLIKLGYKLAVVSASKMSWLNIVLPRIEFAHDLKLVMSLFGRDDLRHKPHPDGYLAAMKKLGVSPKNTIILEDSNPGIQSAKASGAFTIGFRGNLVPGYVQEGADVYAENMNEVLELVKRHGKKLSFK